ncbi:MAG: helix-turn-helix transcriptional regulator [Clostridia bacterium]|nr:helix-turn-helix transcriptional regulator [Clostridia bacterium]
MSQAQIPVIFENAAKEKNRYLHTSFYNLKKENAEFLHYHDVLELGLCLSGRGECLTADGSYPFSKGDVQFILPFQPHYNVTYTEDTLWAFVNIDVPRISSAHISPDPAFLIDLIEKIRIGGIFSASQHPTATALISDIVNLAISRAENTVDINDLITAKLISLLLELSMKDITNAVIMESEKKSSVILPAIKLVSNELNKGRSASVEKMAAACFMSESYFRKIFYSVMGESPKSYITRMQLLKARRLLLSSRYSVAQIATICGFQDNSSFYRRFIDSYGVSPSVYRKSQKK